MRTIFRSALIVLSLAAPALAADPPPTPCRLVRIATLDIDMDSTGRINMPMKFNGTEKRLMVDTGATTSFLTSDAVADLKLKTRSSGNSYMVGFGGRVESETVTVDEVEFAGMKGNNFSFFVTGGWMDAAGLLGGNILSGYDIDLDFAKGKLSVFSQDHCPGKVVYWTNQAYGTVPFEMNGNHIWIKVKIDGEDIRAIVDTGAVDTVMSMDLAVHDFELDKKALARSRHYPFKALSFGTVNVANPAIKLVPDAESGVMGRYSDDLNMILGMGVLRRLHLYIAYKEHVIYVTPATQY
jgi:predicted aspartyl protease